MLYFIRDRVMKRKMKLVAELCCSKNKIFVQLRVRIVQSTETGLISGRPFIIKIKGMASLGTEIREE